MPEYVQKSSDFGRNRSSNRADLDVLSAEHLHEIIHHLQDSINMVEDKLDRLTTVANLSLKRYEELERALLNELSPQGHRQNTSENPSVKRFRLPKITGTAWIGVLYIAGILLGFLILWFGR